jgi:ATP-binding cassette subfamily C protein
VPKGCRVGEIFKKIFSYKKELFIGNFFALLATLLTVTIPLFIPMLIDELLLHKEPKLTAIVAHIFGEMSILGYVLFFLVLAIFMRFLGVIFANMQIKMFLKVSKDISYKLRLKTLEYIKGVALSEYERFSPGAISSKLVTDIDTIDNFIGSAVGKLIISTLILLFTAVILLLINWQLALFILLTNPIVVFFTAKLARRVGKLKKEENKNTEQFQASLNDTLEHFNQIKAANKEEYFFSRVMTRAKSLKDASIKFSYQSDRSMRISIFTFLSGYEVFRSISILAVAYSDLSVGLMLAIFGYLWIMMTPTQDIINFQYSLFTAKAACSRVNELYALEQERHVQKPIEAFDKDAVSVRLENLSFGYQKEQMILKELTLEIEAGKRVAVVGPSGSGKSTLANLIAGFYEPSDGEIFYNDVSYKLIDPREIRQNIYLILQQPKLFNDTMRFNLTLGRDYSEKAIEEALKIAQISNLVEQLESGLDTVIGKDGVKLSGGQRQRVAIARMILENPSCIIFDESTSALDVHTEVNLFKDLREFLQDKTVVTIAHRLSTIESAEYIFVLEDGKLVDSGAPQELFEKESGYFANMV